MATIEGAQKPEEKPDSIQQLKNRFKSGGMAYLILINKSKGFSQSLSGVPTGCDSITENQISADGD